MKPPLRPVPAGPNYPHPLDRVGIGPPDLRTRTALLWRMTTEVPLEISDPGVLHDIAGLAAGNVRRLEGALTRIAALSSVLGEPVNRALIRKALDDPIATDSPSTSARDPEPGNPKAQRLSVSHVVPPRGAPRMSAASPVSPYRKAASDARRQDRL